MKSKIENIRSPKILVTGILGQDGSNMCEYLLRNPKHKVFGMIRRLSNPNYSNCESFLDHPNFQLVYGDLTDEISLYKLVQEIQPDYFINFAANSFVGISWDMPLHVFDVNTSGVIRCLEAIKKHQPNCRFYSAGSSEQFGDVDYSPQDIKHPMKPRSPYGASKCAAHHIVKVYRESYGIYAVHGILFNHEGTRRGEEFVTRKISKGVARIHHALASGKSFKPIELGNIYSKRDWSDSEDFVEGVWLMLNQDEFIEKTDKFNKEFKERWEAFKNAGCALGGGDVEIFAEEIVIENIKDYVLASGETHTIKEFVQKAFRAAGITGSWTEIETEPTATKYYNNSDRTETLVKINTDFYRPAEVQLLLGDASPIMKDLGWKPKSTFDSLVGKMVAYDLELFNEEVKEKGGE